MTYPAGEVALGEGFDDSRDNNRDYVDFLSSFPDADRRHADGLADA